MAIKVRHDGNSAAGASGAMSGGRAKRAMGAATILGKPTQIQMTHAATASTPGISMAHAGGGGGGGVSMAHASMPSAGGSGVSSARLGGGFGNSNAQGTRTSTANQASEDYKVTGSDRFYRPDDNSVWNPSTNQWQRKWLPGEKEAEAEGRILSARQPYLDMQANRYINVKNVTSRSANQDAIERYTQMRRADVAMMPKVSNDQKETDGNAATNAPKEGERGFISIVPHVSEDQKEQVINAATKAAKERARGFVSIVPSGGNQNAPAQETMSADEKLNAGLNGLLQNTNQPNPSYDFASLYANGGSFYGANGVVNTNKVDVANFTFGGLAGF